MFRRGLAVVGLLALRGHRGALVLDRAAQTAALPSELAAGLSAEPRQRPGPVHRRQLLGLPCDAGSG